MKNEIHAPKTVHEEFHEAAKTFCEARIDFLEVAKKYIPIADSIDKSVARAVRELVELAK